MLLLRAPVVCLALALLASCMAVNLHPLANDTPLPNAVNAVNAGGASGPAKVVTLAQGWDERTQLAFWFTSQGAKIMPYGWFLALEQPGNSELFRADSHIDQLGYLPARPGPGSWNPDGLPVGFVKSTGQTDGQPWLGLTCAACHTSQVNYGGVGLRIDGGPSMADFNRFFAELVAAQAATLADEAKFQRFAGRVLGAEATAAQRDELKQALSRQAANDHSRLTLNTPTHAPGPARLDAFGNIFNQVLVVALDEPGNGRPPDAPVSYPFLWDTPQHDRVQWNGSAPNGPFGLGELTRNVGEVLGVFGELHIDQCDPDHCRYPSNVDVVELGKLEGWLRMLWSPKWNPQYLPALDGARIQRGALLYAQQCAACHLPIERADPLRSVQAQMSDVGTDPAMATAAATRIAKTGPLQGRFAFPTLKRYGPTAGGGPLTVQGAVGVLLSDLDLTLLALTEQRNAEIADRLRASSVEAVALARSLPPPPTKAMLEQALGRGSSQAPQATAIAVTTPAQTAQTAQTAQAPAAPSNAVYKARPLNGIWATAPYLHNGSVPTLWDLLQPAAARPRSFFVGSRNFDAVNVGFDSRQGPYRFDAGLPGNANGGHEFGTTLSDAQKWDLMEYLKSL